jgi:hypothetical protein
MLTLVSGANIAAWVLMYRQLHEYAGNSASAFSMDLMLALSAAYGEYAGNSAKVSGIDVMLVLCAAYVFGCAFRSFLPRADVQRICLFDTWLSSVAVGRSVATVAEVCFAAQWAMILFQLGTVSDAETAVNAAWVIVPLILVAECFSWYAVVTTNYFYNAIENSLWAVAFFIVGIGLGRLLPEFDGAIRVILVGSVVGIAVYLAFLMTVDVPMYLKRWRADVAGGNRGLRPLEGLRDVSTRWVVTHDISEWKEEIVWMSLYFSAAVWASLGLCVFYGFEGRIFG